MTQKDQPRTAETRTADRALRALENEKRPQPPMDGISDDPTSPRENPPVDEGRVARAHEDFQRVLGN